MAAAAFGKRLCDGISGCHTFLESYDLTGKTIISFATSGGSGMGKTNEKLQPSYPNSKLIEGKVFKKSASKSELAAWVDGLKLQ